MGKNKKGSSKRKMVVGGDRSKPAVQVRGAEEEDPEALAEALQEESYVDTKRDAEGKKIRKKQKTGEDGGGGEDGEGGGGGGGKAREAALAYLDQWDFDRGAWRFQKVRQAWLLAHALSKTAVPKRSFGILLRYLEGLKGAAREETLRKAAAVLDKRKDGGGEGESEEMNAEEVAEAKRAKKLSLVLAGDKEE